MAKDNVRYRIYIAPCNNNNQSFEVLKQVLILNQICYNITLGTANHSATLENITLFEEKDIEASHVENEFINLHSACNSENVSGIQFEKENQYNFIEEELMPADFKANYDREVVKMNRVIYTTGDLPLTVKLTGLIYKIKDQDQTLNIQFLE
jgi:CRISPR-associated protein Cas5h